MSTHRVDIIEIGDILPCPNAEKLELTHVFGWQCCIGKGQFKKGDKAIYVQPDYETPLHRPEFAFLNKGDGKAFERIKVRRFRGQISQGLIIPVPEHLQHLPVGSNVIDELEVRRYEPPMPKSTSGLFVSGPSGLYTPKFDVESYQRYRHVFVPGEEVVVTEKLHGASARFCKAKNKDGEVIQFVGSRTNWMAEDDANIWHISFRQNPSIGEWCNNNPDKVMYGECFGQVQVLKFGAGKNDIFFAAFGILDQNRWLDYDEFAASAKECNVPVAPLLYRGPLDENLILELAEQDSKWPKANHMAEGCVILPVKERTHPEVGRVQLKIVSNRYLLL